MELMKAFQMSVEYLGRADKIRVDGDGRVCLTDMAKYFPRKRLDNWMRLGSTTEFIETVDRFLKTSDVSDLKSIYRKRGKYDGGTYAHELIALEFAAWLSPEFKLKVLYEYQNGTQRKENWNIKRILAAHNYKLLSLAVYGAHEPAKQYHYSNEALMINEIVFGVRDKNVRDSATVGQLDAVAALEGHNATMIELGMSYQDRKEALIRFSQKAIDV